MTTKDLPLIRGNAVKAWQRYEELAEEAKGLNARLAIVKREQKEAAALLEETFGDRALMRLPGGLPLEKKVVSVAERTQTVKAYSYTTFKLLAGGK